MMMKKRKLEKIESSSSVGSLRLRHQSHRIEIPEKSLRRPRNDCPRMGRDCAIDEDCKTWLSSIHAFSTPYVVEESIKRTQLN